MCSQSKGIWLGQISGVNVQLDPYHSDAASLCFAQAAQPLSSGVEKALSRAHLRSKQPTIDPTR